MDRRYEFIADPAHKENLSGRVTAACLNCRRKKIKCSGEAVCRQCREKGLVCEGPPSRKRPRKEDAASSAGEAPLLKNEQSQSDVDQEGDRRVQQQQEPQLLPAALSKEDSGYGDHGRGPWRASDEERSLSEEAVHISTASTRSHPHGQPSNAGATSSTFGSAAHQPLMSPLPPNFTSPFAFNTSVPHRSPPTNVSPSTVSPEEWSYVPQPNTATRTSYNNPSAHSRPQHSARSASAVMSAEPMDWSRRGSNDWWSTESGNAQTSADLITAAEALEDQAQGLRRQAARRQSGESDDMRSQPASQPSQPVGMRGSPMQTPYYDSSLRPPDAFDPSAFFHPDGSLRSGLTPSAGSFAPSWDVGGELQQPNRADGIPVETGRTAGGMRGSGAPTSQSSGSARSSFSHGTGERNLQQERRRYQQ
ncbi:hypothetical protein LTR65_005337 [Meristemomyces frigidus]